MTLTKTILSRLTAALLLALSLFHFAAAVRESQRHGFVDFPIFLQRAARFVDQGELYVDVRDPAAYAPAAPVYKFPPTFAMLLLPFVRAAPQSVYVGHWILQLGLYLLAAALALIGLRSRRRAPFLVAGGVLVLNFEPFFETLWRLQLETPILLLLVICLLAYVRGRDFAAGAALGLAAMLKIYPAFLLLYFLARRRFRVIGGALAVAALVQLASMIVMGVETNRIFYFEVLPRLLGEPPLANSENVGLARYVLLLFDVDPAAAKRIAQVSVLLLLAASLYAVELNRRAGRERRAIELAIFVPLMLLSTPNSWVNYQLLLLAPMLVLFAEGLGPPPRWEILAPTIVAAGLLLFYRPCPELASGWPCADTPAFLGLGPLPRGLHDLFVELRGLATLIVWGVASAAASDPGAARRGSAGVGQGGGGRVEA